MLIASLVLISELRRGLGYPKLAAVIKDPEVLADLIEAAAVLIDPERTITVVSHYTTTAPTASLTSRPHSRLNPVFRMNSL